MSHCVNALKRRMVLCKSFSFSAELSYNSPATAQSVTVVLGEVAVKVLAKVVVAMPSLANCTFTLTFSSCSCLLRPFHFTHRVNRTVFCTFPSLSTVFCEGNFYKLLCNFFTVDLSTKSNNSDKGKKEEKWLREKGERNGHSLPSCNHGRHFCVWFDVSN